MWLYSGGRRILSGLLKPSGVDNGVYIFKKINKLEIDWCVEVNERLYHAIYQ